MVRGDLEKEKEGKKVTRESVPSQSSVVRTVGAQNCRSG